MDMQNNIVNKTLHKPAPPIHEPPCELHGWSLLPNGRIFAELMKNHPRLGSGPNALTGTILYINRELRIASSKRTTYRLFDEKPA